MWRMIAQHALRNDRLHLLGSESGVEESSIHLTLPAPSDCMMKRQKAQADNAPKVTASTRMPRAMSPTEANSSGRWLYPLRQGMNSIATGAIRAMNRES